MYTLLLRAATRHTRDRIPHRGMRLRQEFPDRAEGVGVDAVESCCRCRRAAIPCRGRLRGAKTACFGLSRRPLVLHPIKLRQHNAQPGFINGQVA